MNHWRSESNVQKPFLYMNYWTILPGPKVMHLSVFCSFVLSQAHLTSIPIFLDLLIFFWSRRRLNCTSTYNSLHCAHIGTLSIFSLALLFSRHFFSSSGGLRICSKRCNVTHRIEEAIAYAHSHQLIPLSLFCVTRKTERSFRPDREKKNKKSNKIDVDILPNRSHYISNFKKTKGEQIRCFSDKKKSGDQQ